MKLININKEKLQNAIIYFSRHTKHCGLTKVMKLLYFLDFIAITFSEFYQGNTMTLAGVMGIDLN